MIAINRRGYIAKGKGIMSDIAMREEIGLTQSQAVAQAEKHNKITGDETYVFFRTHDPDLGNRYDWCTELGLNTSDAWVSPGRIIWSSTDGFY